MSQIKDVSNAYWALLQPQQGQRQVAAAVLQGPEMSRGKETANQNMLTGNTTCGHWRGRRRS